MKKGLFASKFIKIILIVFCFFVLSLIIGITAFSAGKSKQEGYACQLLPEEYSTLIYIKNLPKLIKEFVKSDFAKKFKDNYVYLDFKYKYYQNVDMFFVKLNFNAEKFLKLIKKDLVIGKSGRNFFIISSINYKAKLIYSILNLDEDKKINEKKYKEYDVYYVAKGYYTVYYTIINNYLIITDNMSLIESIINNQKKPGSDKELYNTCSDEEIYIKTKPMGAHNKYDILPSFDTFGLKVNISNLDVNIFGVPYGEISKNNDLYVDKDFEFLKLMNNDFSLLYYNNLYNTKSVISEIIANHESRANNPGEVREAYKNLEGFDLFKDGAYFLFKSFGYSSNSSGLSPEAGVLLKLKNNLTKEDKKNAINSFKNIINFVFGIKNWDIKANELKNYTVNYSNDNSFCILIYDDWFLLCNGRDFMKKFIDKIESPGASLYDKYVDKLPDIKKNDLTAYLCVDLNSLINAVEPIFEEYISINLNFEDDEYQKSFGQFFDYTKAQGALFVKLYHNNESGYYGKIDFIK